VYSIPASVYSAATTPAIAMAAAAKLPTLCGPAAAAPVELALDPEPVLLAALAEVAEVAATTRPVISRQTFLTSRGLPTFTILFLMTQQTLSR